MQAIRFLALSLFSLTFLATAQDSKIVVSNGQKIAFLGDSITAQGKGRLGYCQLVLAALKD